MTGVAQPRDPRDHQGSAPAAGLSNLDGDTTRDVASEQERRTIDRERKEPPLRCLVGRWSGGSF